MVYFGQLAHEYGHHVQKLAGIIDVSWHQRHQRGIETPGGREISRRFELQATCYGGMFLSAVDRHPSERSALVDEALSDSRQRGDRPGSSPEHGLPEINADWVGRGFQRHRTDECDTWQADLAKVRRHAP